MNKISCFVVSLLFSILSFAQVDNYAVEFNGQSNLNFNKIPELNHLSTYTVQFWICPSAWTSGTSLFKRGTGTSAFEAHLGTSSGTIEFRVGNQSFSVASTEFITGKWAQLTVIIENNRVKPYVNGVPLTAQTAAASLIIPEDASDFIIGEGFAGRIDEFRFWSAALDETEYLTEDPTVKGYLLWDNTLNKYHPQYESLLLYYKFDQNLCENIVDYTFRHHGIMNGVTRKIVTDNPLFKYRVVSAYTEFSRFTDVGTDQAKYLLCNDLVALSASLGTDGSAGVSLPFDKGTLVGGASYLAEYNGRSGVLALDGTGRMNVGTTAMNVANAYSFGSWFYIDEWVENAFLFKKERDDQTGISLRLGNESTAEVILRLNGDEYKYKAAGELVVGKWIHLGFSPYDDTTLGRTFLFACNKKKLNIYPYSYPATLKPWTLPDLKDVEAFIGENFKGKFDETMIWNSGTSRDGFFDFADNGPNMPGFGKNVGVNYAFYAGCFWSYDKSEDPGYDYFSYKEYLDIMRSAYAGYRGFKIRISVSGSGNWQATIANAAKRERFTTEMAAIINEDDYLDGVDFDLEWPEYGGQGPVWTNYGKLMTLLRSKLKPGKILTISPHSVSYWFPKEDMASVDYFLFQNYGPAYGHFTYEAFPIAYNSFLSWGFPNEKVLMSFATTTSKNVNTNTPPVRIYNLAGIGPDDNISNGYYFTGFNQTRWRSEQVKKQNLGGIMCWSLNCDYASTENSLSLFRASALAIASNVDTLITKVDMKPVNIKSNYTSTSEFTIYPNPSAGEVNIVLPKDETIKMVSVYSHAGMLMKQQDGLDVGSENTYKYVYGNLEPGSYILNLKTISAKKYSKTMIVK